MKISEDIRSSFWEDMIDSRLSQSNKDRLVKQLMCDSLKEKKTSSKKEEKDIPHCPKYIFMFLHKFAENQNILKYTTHPWEKDDSNNYMYESLDAFKERYKMELSVGEVNLNGIFERQRHLWKTIKNFLLPESSDSEKYTWSKYKLRIGYDDYLAQWLNDNPGNQPSSAPISCFPIDNRPHERIKKKTISYFFQVIEVFKHCIEFRDNDLYFAVKRIFKSPDIILDQNSLETLKGRSIYTDTEEVEEALSQIPSNLRSSYPDVRISCKLIEDQTKLQLRILQVDSFSDKNIEDRKLGLNSDVGTLSMIRKKLMNLCDFSVESKFRVDGQLKDYRINYLSENADIPFHEPLEENSCLGFTYVFTFYNSLKD